MKLSTLKIAGFTAVMLLSANSFADYDEYDYSDESGAKKNLVQKIKEYTSSTPGNFTQVKMAAGMSRAGNSHLGIPVISLGRRFEIGDAAIEISGTWGEHKTSNESRSSFITLPKFSYIGFLQPNSQHSFYYGGGLSWGQVKWDDHINNSQSTKFHGMFAEGVLGYELHRTSALRTMVEFSVSQPMMAHKKIGSTPGPVASLGLSIGF